jgi:hypothetical protein
VKITNSVVSLIQREEHRLRASEKKVLRRIFGHKREKNYDPR